MAMLSHCDWNRANPAAIKRIEEKRTITLLFVCLYLLHDSRMFVSESQEL